MEKVRDRATGKLLDKSQYLSLLHEWRSGVREEKPVIECPHDVCKGKAYVNVLAQSWHAAGQEATVRQIKNPDHFSHMPHAAHKDCPDNYANDPRFSDLTNHASPEVIARNRQVLSEPLLKRRNQLVLDKLMTAALRRAPTDADYSSKQFTAAKNWVMQREFIASNPWLVPFAVAAMSGYHKPQGKGYTVTYDDKDRGRQEISYVDIKGTQRVQIVPREIQLSFVNRGGRLKAMSNPTNKRPIHNYEVSFVSWAKLAGVAVTPAAPVVAVSAAPAAPVPAKVEAAVKASRPQPSRKPRVPKQMRLFK